MLKFKISFLNTGLSIIAFILSIMIFMGITGCDKGIDPIIEEFEADFIVSSNEGTVPLTIICTNKSIGDYDECKWEFGDGTTSQEINPTHIYNDTGQFTVSLSIEENNGRTDYEEKENYIRVKNNPNLPVFNFSISPNRGTWPLEVSFKSIIPDSYNSCAWDFGNGLKSYEKNPVHTYDKTGVYTVKLKISGSDGDTTIIKNNCVEVTPQENKKIIGGLKDGPFWPKMVSEDTDCDFSKNGVKVKVSAKLIISDDRTQLIGQYSMDAIEEKSDWTHAYGSWEEELWTSTDEWKIASIESVSESKAEYIDFDTAADTLKADLCNFIVYGETFLGDVCNILFIDRTRMRVKFNQVKLVLEK